VARDVRPVQEYRPAPMSLAQRAALRSQGPRALRQPARRRVYPLITLGVLLAVLVVAAAVFEYRYRDRVYPNVYVRPANINVGSQTQADVVQSLHMYDLDQRFRTVTLLAPTGPIQVKAYVLGYSLDRNLTAFHAVRTGHDGNILRQAAFQLGLLIHSADVPAVQRVNRLALRDELFKLTGLTDRRPGPGIKGYRLVVVEAERVVRRRLLGSGSGPVRLPVTTIPALPKPRPRPVVRHGHKKSR